jgi:hypothetical protein
MRPRLARSALSMARTCVRVRPHSLAWRAGVGSVHARAARLSYHHYCTGCMGNGFAGPCVGRLSACELGGSGRRRPSYGRRLPPRRRYLRLRSRQDWRLHGANRRLRGGRSLLRVHFSSLKRPTNPQGRPAVATGSAGAPATLFEACGNRSKCVLAERDYALYGMLRFLPPRTTTRRSR